MNVVTKNLTDVLSHPSSRLSQHLHIWIGTLDLNLDVLNFKVRVGLSKDYTVDATVISPRLDIDGKLCVGRRAGLQIDERAAVPSASYVDPIDHEAAAVNGVITRWKRIRRSRDEGHLPPAHRAAVCRTVQGHVRVASESADVQVAARSKITLNSGEASLVSEDGNMTFHCPGAFTIKAGSFTFVGPDNVPAQLPILPKSDPTLNDRYSHTN